MKKFTSTFLLASFLALTACGGGGAGSAAPGAAPTVNSQVFTVITIDRTATQVGNGATLAARQTDAATQVAAATKPGTNDYAALLSQAGLLVRIVDESQNGATAHAKLLAAGLAVTLDPK